MQVSELRIGNLVCFIQRNNNAGIPDMPVESLFYRVEGLGLWEVHCREGLFNPPSNPSDKRISGITDVSGIRLTEEWLRKFGFEQDKDDIFIINNVMFWLDDGRLQIADGYTPLINAPCKYVHQLQNLYFALMGEELKLQS